MSWFVFFLNRKRVRPAMQTMLCIGLLFVLSFAVDGILCQNLSYVSPYAPADCKQTKPAGVAWNSEASTGTWYQYMYGPPNNPLTDLTNAIEVYRGIGWQYDSGQNGPVYTQSFSVTGRDNAAPNACWASYGMQNTSCNGFAYTKGYFGGSGAGAVGDARTFVKLYLDPNFLYIRVSCFTSDDTPRAEKCDMAGVAVFTRKMPKDITPLENIIIRDTLDDRLQLYCMTSKDMVLVQWLDLPPCDYTDLKLAKPQVALNEWKTAQDTWVEKCSKPGSGSCSPASFY